MKSMKRTKKKAMSYQIWLYIMTGIVVAVVVMSFSRFISTFKERESEIALATFFGEFSEEIELNRDNYGNVKEVEFYIGKIFNEICFSEYGFATSEGIVHLEVIDILDQKIEKNIFVFQEEKLRTHYVEGIIIEKLSSTKYGCYNVTEGQISLRLESRGTKTLIGPADPTMENADCVIKVPDVMNARTLKPELWHLDQKYFRRDDEGVITSACGKYGWENVELIER